MKARPIGVLKMLDDGEVDDKVLAVLAGSELGSVSSVEELKRKFPGVTEIVETWFANYKGPGRIEANGYAEASEARALVKAAAAAYEQAKSD